MPEGSKVDRCYQKLVDEGKTKEQAARICQAATGQSLQTGKKAEKKEGKNGTLYK